VLDINEKILDVLNLADIVFWPVAMDIKYSDVEAMPDQGIDVCFFNGGIRNTENEHMAKLLRQKSKVLVAFGSCAHEGCVIGLANEWTRKDVFDRVYHETPSTENPDAVQPTTHLHVEEGDLELPQFYDTLKTLDQTVEVDYYLPGCPPHPSLVLAAVDAIATNQLPPKGSVIGPTKSICDECTREKHDRKIDAIRRIYEIDDDGVTCFWELGVPCMGPATRAGCGAQCLSANMPCTGCQGPGPAAREQGSAMMSALSSVVEDVAVLDQLVDPIGTFYKFSLPHSLLRRRRTKQ
jgi:F420-non-reducing hydrogenase small subunit